MIVTVVFLMENVLDASGGDSLVFVEDVDLFQVLRRCWSSVRQRRRKDALTMRLHQLRLNMLMQD